MLLHGGGSVPGTLHAMHDAVLCPITAASRLAVLLSYGVVQLCCWVQLLSMLLRFYMHSQSRAEVGGQLVANMLLADGNVRLLRSRHHATEQL